MPRKRLKVTEHDMVRQQEPQIQRKIDQLQQQQEEVIMDQADQEEVIMDQADQAPAPVEYGGDFEYDGVLEGFRNLWHTAEDERLEEDLRFTFQTIANATKACHKPADYNHPLYKDSKLTKGEFYNEAFRALYGNKIKSSAQDSIWNFLQKVLPEGTEIGKGFHSSSNGNVTGLNYVMNSTTSTILFDVCINGDQVYSGDYADGKTCIHPSCGESRYTECSVPSCPSRGEQRDQSLCHHANRSPRRTLTYRPFTSLIIELLSQPGFETAINYKDINLEKDSEAYVDLLCGEQPQKHIKQMNKKAKKYLKEMKKNFQKKQAEHDANVSNEELISIVLILGLSYDGVQIFKRKTSHFWPLFFEILNLPPTFRIKHGVGLFLAALFTSVTGGGVKGNRKKFAERYLLKSCLGVEMDLFEKGVTLHVGGKSYFVQVRMINQCYDTKAAEKIFNWKLSNSLVGCQLCRMCKGTKVAALNQTIYHDNSRKFLRSNHPWRRIGHSRVSAAIDPDDYKPAGSRGGVIVETVEEGDSDDEEEGYVIDTDGNGPSRAVDAGNESDGDDGAEADNNEEDDYPIAPTSRREEEAIVIEYDGDNDDDNDDEELEPFVSASSASAAAAVAAPPVEALDERMLNNDAYRTADFSDYMNFERVDTRPQVTYSRVLHETYQEDAAATLRATNKAYVSNGVRDFWPFEGISYARLDQNFVYCIFHVFENIVKRTMELILGKRGNNAKAAAYCKDLGIHAHTWREKPLYEIKESTQPRIDLCLSAINIPIGYKQDCNFLSFMQRVNTIQGAAKIFIFTNLLHFITFCIKQIEPYYPKQYLNYLRLLSDQFAMLQRPHYVTPQIAKVFHKVTEYVATHDGLFPPSEGLMPYHQLIDQAPYIPQFGLPSSSSTAAAERANYVIKSFVPQGGQHIELSTCERMVAYEIAKMQKAYSFENSSSRKNWDPSILPSYYYSFDDEKKQLVFDNTQIMLNKLSSTDIVLTAFEQKELLLCMYFYVLERFNGNELEAFQSSSFFRVYNAFLVNPQHSKQDLQRLSGNKNEERIENNKKRRGIVTKETICEWLELEKMKPEYCMLQLFEVDEQERFTEGWYRPEDDVVLEAMAGLVGNSSFVSKHYKKAFVHGTKLTARGPNWRNVEPPRPLTYGNATSFVDKGNLKRNWYKEIHYNCWIKYRAELFRYDKPSKRRGASDGLKYGIVNSFLKVKLPGDALLNNFSVASVTSYEHHNDPVNKLDIVNKFKVDQDPYDPQAPNFIPMEYVIPEPVATAGFTSRDATIVNSRTQLSKAGKVMIPIIVQTNHLTGEQRKHETKYTTDVYSIENLIMIGLKRQNSYLV